MTISKDVILLVGYTTRKVVKLMRKFINGDKAFYRGETVVVGKNRKTNEAGQTWYYVKPASKRSEIKATYVRSDHLQFAL